MNNEFDREALEFAATVCTEKQMQVLKMRSDGIPLRQIARELLITPSSAKDRLDGALLRLRRVIIEREGE